jgi:exopolyphosphatase/guanosine-5'-triphosphate,3'-diphosphate pyrophosphatase
MGERQPSPLGHPATSARSARWIAAAIDCGTNSTRLLVSDEHGAQLARELRVTRLGEGVDARHALGRDAIDRTIEALQTYRTLMDELGVVAFRAVATSAVRDASNGQEFLGAAAAVLGTPVEVLSGEEEGRLAYAGAVSELDPSGGPYVVLDIGGGSTELTALVPGDTSPRVVSLDVGCVRLTERYLHHDPPLAAELEATAAAVRCDLDRAATVLPILSEVPQQATLVGLAGTVTTLSMLAHGWTAYDPKLVHHSELALRTVEEWTDRLAAETIAARAAHAGMVEGREDVIVGGVLVMREVMRRFAFSRCIVSESDILDGLVASLAAPRAARP